MIEIANINVSGWEAAIRGMRNPMNSWDKGDSGWCFNLEINKSRCDAFCCDGCYESSYEVGNNDLKLMKTLSKAGNDHAKFLRMINVTMDITAPLYWWKEFDTYKVGTTANSCSTMHKIHSKPIELDDFSIEDCILCEAGKEYFAELEKIRLKYLNTNDKKYWRALIQLLPSSYNQKRTVQLNYQVLKHMYFSRKNHKLDEWWQFCDRILELPYFKEICIDI